MFIKFGVPCRPTVLTISAHVYQTDSYKNQPFLVNLYPFFLVNLSLNVFEWNLRPTIDSNKQCTVVNQYFQVEKKILL